MILSEAKSSTYLHALFITRTINVNFGRQSNEISNAELKYYFVQNGGWHGYEEIILT